MVKYTRMLKEGRIAVCFVVVFIKNESDAV